MYQLVDFKRGEALVLTLKLDNSCFRGTQCGDLTPTARQPAENPGIELVPVQKCQ